MMGSLKMRDRRWRVTAPIQPRLEAVLNIAQCWVERLGCVGVPIPAIASPEDRWSETRWGMLEVCEVFVAVRLTLVGIVG